MIDPDRPDVKAGLLRRLMALFLLVPIAVGFVVLAEVGLMALDGFRAPIGEAVITALGGGLGGVGAGLTAVLGAMGGLLLTRRGDAATNAAIGAGLAILVPSWIYAVVFFLRAANYNILGAVIAAVGLVGALIAALLAGLIVAASERRARRRAPVAQDGLA